MVRWPRWCAVAFLSLLLIEPTLACAQETAGLAGRWKGEIRLPGAPLSVEAVFSEASDGALEGFLSIPMEGAFDIPLRQVQQERDEVSFRMADAPGQPSFHGWMAEDGRYLTGRFRQDSQEFDFRLERVSPALEGKGEGRDSVRSDGTPGD